jgi:hypothetical protein
MRSTASATRTYPSVVAVNEKRVSLLVQNKAQDGLHGLDGDLCFLGPLHIEDVVPDLVRGDECVVSRRQIFLHEGARSMLGWL